MAAVVEVILDVADEERVGKEEEEEKEEEEKGEE